MEFAELEEEAILAYIASGEPMDKAGAYGIQVSNCRSVYIIYSSICIDGHFCCIMYLKDPGL